MYASLAIELEMNKAVDLLRQGDLDGAIEALLAFNNKESKVASAAANNLAMINIMVGAPLTESRSQTPTAEGEVEAAGSSSVCRAGADLGSLQRERAGESW